MNLDDNSSPYVPTHLVVSTMQGSDYINFKMIDSNNKLVPSRCTSLYDKPGSASRQSTSKKYLLYILRLTFFFNEKYLFTTKDLGVLQMKNMNHCWNRTWCRIYILYEVLYTTHQFLWIVFMFCFVCVRWGCTFSPF